MDWRKKNNLTKSLWKSDLDRTLLQEVLAELWLGSAITLAKYLAVRSGVSLRRFEDEIESAAGDALTETLKSWDGKRSAFSSWLWNFVHWKVLNIRRDHQRSGLEREERLIESTKNGLRAPEIDMDLRLETSRIFQTLRRSKERGEIILLSRLEGKTLPEIAKEFRISKQRVAEILTKEKRKCRKKLLFQNTTSRKST